MHAFIKSIKNFGDGRVGEELTPKEEFAQVNALEMVQDLGLRDNCGFQGVGLRAP